jgi:virginiamycin B lyase
MKKLIPLLLFLLILLPAKAEAARVGVKFFPVPMGSTPLSTVPGPAGSLWFTDWNTNSVGSVTTSGKITEYSVAAQLTGEIARGAKYTLWLAAQNRIVRRAANGTMTNFPLSDTPRSLTYDSGNVWFLEGKSYYGSITPEGKVTRHTFPKYSGVFEDGLESHMTAGPDGNLWITESNANQIARLTPTGTLTEFSIPSAPLFQGIRSSRPGVITSGPYKSLWFTEMVGDKIGKVALDGTITEITPHSPTGGPSLGNATSMTPGPDGAMWLTISFPGQVWRMAPNGAARSFNLGQNDQPGGITSVDGNIWVASFAGFYEFVL